MDALEKAAGALAEAKHHFGSGDVNAGLINLQIAQTQAHISTAESLKRLADHYVPSLPEPKAVEPGGYI